MIRNDKAQRPAVSTFAGNVGIADALVDRGFRVFPLAPDKRPLTLRGFHDARCDAAPLRARPSALVGMPTANFWVLDLDPPLEACVPLLLAMLRMDWRELTAECGLIVRTPRGGMHLCWRRTPGVAIRTAAGGIARDIDTRGHDADGKPTGYIVAPGCVLPDGRRYEIEQGGFDDLCEAPRRLLWLASLSRVERARIAANPGLTAEMRNAEPSAWRGILAAHVAAARVPLLPLKPEDCGPMRRQAEFDLDAERHRLAGLADGRRGAIFGAAARLARYAASGVLSAEEIEAGLIEAWIASGAGNKHGLVYPRSAIHRALDKGRNDPLPPLMRCFRDDRDGGRP